MKLTKKVVYEVEHIVPDVGKLEGEVEILCKQKLPWCNVDIIYLRPYNSYDGEGEAIHQIDYTKVPDSHKGRLLGTFYFPVDVPVKYHDGGVTREENSNSKACVEAIYEALKKIIDQENFDYRRWSFYRIIRS